MNSWEFLPSPQLCEYLLLRRRGSGMPELVYLLLYCASFSYHLICFFASDCLQISLLTVLLEGVLMSVDKINRSPGERGNPSLPRPAKIITPQQAPHNTFSFLLLRLMDCILSTDYCHVFNYFCLFFLTGLGWLYG